MIETLSLCPTCYKKIQAEIYFIDGQAIMKKNCDQHGDFSAVVEKDAQHFSSFYELGTMDNNNTIIIHAHNQCNMKCKWCYYPMGVEKMHSAEYYDMVLRMYKGKYRILVSGGEPTIRPDYFDFMHRLDAYGWDPCTITNMIKLSDPEFFKKTLTPLFVDGNLYKFAMSMQHPKHMSEDILQDKVKAFKNIEAAELQAMCVMFSIESLDELDWIKEFYMKTRHLYKMVRIRTMFKNWDNKHDGSNLFCSDLHKAFMDRFSEFSPVQARRLEHSNSYCLYLQMADGMEISLSSSPTVENVDYHLCSRPAIMLAMDGRCYPVPLAQIINEGISLGYKDGFKIGEK